MRRAALALAPLGILALAPWPAPVAFLAAVALAGAAVGALALAARRQLPAERSD